MFSLSKIYLDNRATYYNYNTGLPSGRTTFFACVFTVSLLCALFFNEPSDNFLGAVITAQSILAGFGFNVLFFLLSSANSIPKPDIPTLETKLRRDRLTKISSEIFSNISYFNVVSIMSVLTAIVVLMPGFSSGAIQHLSKLVMEYFPEHGETVDYFASCARSAFRICLITLLYLLVLESIYTFIRTISRITFYFGRKLELLHLSDDSDR